MLWIDGHKISGKLVEKGKNLEAAAEILNDWNCFAIQSGSAFVFNAEKRFQMGYHFASENAAKLIEHTMLSGNRLTIVAYGRGIAFAEGIAAFLYEERRIKVHRALLVYGNWLKKTPQLEESIKYRIVIGRAGKKHGSNGMNIPVFKSIYLEEKKLPGSFYKYNIYAYLNRDKYPLGFFIKKDKRPKLSFISKKSNQPALFWDVVSHAINTLETADSIFDYEHSTRAKLHGFFNLSYN